jgi:hypothetical protein
MLTIVMLTMNAEATGAHYSAHQPLALQMNNMN